MNYTEFKIKVWNEVKQDICCFIERIDIDVKQYCLVVGYIGTNLISTRRYDSIDEVFNAAEKKKYRQGTMHYYNGLGNWQPSWIKEKVIRNTKIYNVTTGYTKYYIKVF